MAVETVDETTPLLKTQSTKDAESAIDESTIGTSRRLRILVQYLLIFLLFEFTAILTIVPMNPIQEAILCHRYYPDSDSGNLRCKDQVVQADFASLKAWENTFGLIPGLLTAIPYGVVAEKRGRRFVLALALFGTLLMQCVTAIICTPFPLCALVRD